MNIQTEDKGNLTRYTKNMMISMHGMFKHPAEVVVEGEGDGGEMQSIIYETNFNM